MRMPMGGSANFTVSEDVKAAVANAAEANTRAVQLTIDAKACTCNLGTLVEAGSNLKEDWEKIAAVLEPGVPCVLLLRNKPVDGDADAPQTGDNNPWTLCPWTPDDTPVKLRMTAATSQKSIKQAFDDLTFKPNYPMTDKDEATFDAWKSATATMTEEDRRAAMTQQEIDQEDAHKASEEERYRQPNRQVGLAGLGHMTITWQESFKTGLQSVLGGEGIAAVGSVVGDKAKEVSGETLEGIAAPSDLKGKLPQEEPRFVLLKIGEDLLLISWLPELAPVRARMTMSTYKHSVIEQIKTETGKDKILTAEVSLEEWLTDDLGKKAEEEAPKAVPGGVKMPGMPAGGFKLPGM